MELLTKELEKRFADIGKQNDTQNDLVVCKFFTPDGCATWYATEAYYVTEDEEILFGSVPGLTKDDPSVLDVNFFGWATLFPGEGEYGYFSLSELREVSGALGLGVERDLYLGDHSIGECIAKGL